MTMTSMTNEALICGRVALNALGTFFNLRVVGLFAVGLVQYVTQGVSSPSWSDGYILQVFGMCVMTSSTLHMTNYSVSFVALVAFGLAGVLLQVTEQITKIHSPGFHFGIMILACGFVFLELRAASRGKRSFLLYRGLGFDRIAWVDYLVRYGFHVNLLSQVTILLTAVATFRMFWKTSKALFVVSFLLTLALVIYTSPFPRVNNWRFWAQVTYGSGCAALAVLRDGQRNVKKTQ